MSEEKRPQRTDYRASVESGLKRLESEKLAFLGSSQVISMFDPGIVKEYAQLVGEESSEKDGEFSTQEFPSVDEPSSAKDGDGGEDYLGDLLSDCFAQVQDDGVRTDIQTSSSIVNALNSLMDVASKTDGASNQENRDGAGRLTTLKFMAIRDREHESVDIDSCETCNVGDIAERVRHDLEMAAEGEEPDETVNITDIAEGIRRDSDIKKTDTEWKSIRDFSVTDSGLEPVSESAGNEAKQANEVCERRTIQTGVGEGLAKTQDSSQLDGDIQKFLEAERRGISTEYPPMEEYLESCETQDVGSIAEQIRQELATTSEAVAPEYRGGTPQAQIFRTAQSEPKPRQPESNVAMERLKEQGVFEPVPIIHAEVDKNLNEIHSLDQVLPPSAMKSCSSVEFSKADDMSSDDEDAVHELRQAAELVRAAHNAADHIEPRILPIDTADDSDIENNSTIPMRMPVFSDEDEDEDLSMRITTRENKVVPKSPATSETAISNETENEARAQFIWYAVIFVLVCGILYMLYLTGVFASISPMLDPLKEENIEVVTIDNPVEDLVLEDDVTFISPEDMDAVIQEASAIVSESMAFETWLGDSLNKTMEQLPSPESRIPYLELLYEISEDKTAAIKSLVLAWQSAGQHDKAMEFIKSIPVTPENEAFLSQMRLDILKSNPRFLSPVTDLSEEMCDTIDPLGGGSTLTFKMKLNGENIGAFKPDQTRRQSNYRSEIAAWRLCELLECDFSIPWNRPIRIEHAVFEKLYSRSKSTKSREYRKEMKDIIWEKSDGKTYVYGTMKDWVPNFTRFPIEYTSFWLPWLSQSPYIPEYKPLGEALNPLKHNKNTQKLLPEIMAQSKGLTVKNLAAQVSDILVFDYLVGNWDRFSGVGSWWGVNCQYKDGHIVSIDNGAAFPKFGNDKVYQRFMMTERFSARFIKNLRELDKDATFQMLFPEPTKHETASFEQFWKQRASVLSRVDALSEKYGKEKVLSL
ncbi:MAG: hypothetical protein IJU23_06710 [Proteobacteria bacterium]|nr:hypothetical protein [Pseudomonadota bacterium]